MHGKKMGKQKQSAIKCRFVHLRLKVSHQIKNSWSESYSCLVRSTDVGLLPEQQPVCQDWRTMYRSCLNTSFYLRATHLGISADFLRSRWWTSWITEFNLIKNQPKHNLFSTFSHFYTHICCHTFFSLSFSQIKTFFSVIIYWKLNPNILWFC